MSTSSELTIDLRQAIFAIESAVSLVGMKDTNHGKRVGYIASKIGRELGLSEQNIQFSFELGLLHDCGVSTEKEHNILFSNLDWSKKHVHCETGYRLLKDFHPLSKYALPILYHHTPWHELNALNISMQDARMANLIFLADSIDVQAAAHYDVDILLVKDQIVKAITDNRGKYFNPQFIEVFQRVGRCEAFWISLEERHITRYSWDMGQQESYQTLSVAQLKQFSLIMSHIVDKKSPFTANHSIRVAELSRYLALVFGLAEEQCEKVEIAGLLHDIGKLHIPDNILDKPGALTDLERAIMNKHSYETYGILRHIKGLEEISLWAAFHHEALNGVGYPFHPKENELSIEARIIAVADIFQALVEDRPYRYGMVLSKAIDIIEELTNKGRLDRDILNLIKEHKEVCFKIAKGLNENHSSLFSLLLLEDHTT